MGRNFLSSDTACIIVNETAIKEMGLKEPLNQVITPGFAIPAHIQGRSEQADAYSNSMLAPWQGPSLQLNALCQAMTMKNEVPAR